MSSVVELLGELPQWVYDGVVVGLVASVVVAVLFVTASRLFPTDHQPRRRTGERRRRDELRAYLDAIDEQYAEGHFVAGQHVAFYLPKRDVAITFDARAYYRIERTGTAAVLVEHEMPGTQLGQRLPFETPDVDFGRADDSDRDPTAEAFAILDVPTTASVEEVRAAYRSKVMEVHPDQGGDEQAFRRVREAYTTAKKHTQ